MLDESLQVTYANPAAETLLAHGRKHLIGAPRSTARCRATRRSSSGCASRSRHEAGFNDNDLVLEVGGEPAHLHCVHQPGRSRARRACSSSSASSSSSSRSRARRSILEQQQANRELIRNLAHEIKNPLGGIRGAAQLLERELADPELREFTQVIVKETDRLQSLMNRLLTPNRLPRVEPLNIHEVIERVRTLLLAEFPEGLDDPARLRHEPARHRRRQGELIQAILNVARNAAQATGGQGEIRFVTRIARQVTIARSATATRSPCRSRTTGPGVPPELAERIFYPLVSGREGGTGLGLSLAQSFVSQHHGHHRVRERSRDAPASPSCCRCAPRRSGTTP